MCRSPAPPGSARRDTETAASRQAGRKRRAGPGLPRSSRRARGRGTARAPPAPGPQRGPFPRGSRSAPQPRRCQSPRLQFQSGKRPAAGPTQRGPCPRRGAEASAAERGGRGAGQLAEPPAVRAAGHPMKVRSAARLHGTLPGASPSRTAVLRAPPRPQAAPARIALHAATSTPQENFSLAAAAEPPGPPALRREPAQSRPSGGHLAYLTGSRTQPGGQRAPGPSGTGPPLFQPRDTGAPAPPPAVYRQGGPGAGGSPLAAGQRRRLPPLRPLLIQLTGRARAGGVWRRTVPAVLPRGRGLRDPELCRTTGRGRSLARRRGEVLGRIPPSWRAPEEVGGRSCVEAGGSLSSDLLRELVPGF